MFVKDITFIERLQMRFLLPINLIENLIILKTSYCKIQLGRK